MDEKLSNIIKELSEGGPNAVRSAKNLISRINTITDYNELRDFSTGEIASIRATPEGKEGIQSFLDKRKPNWTQ